MVVPTPNDGASRYNASPQRKDGLADFFPGYFAMVMATGIASLAAHRQGLEIVAEVLFWINVVAYATFWILTLIRFVRYRAKFINDLTHHSRSAAFLTTIAATCILGAQFGILTIQMGVAKGFWIFGVILWLILSYTFFTVITVREPKPRLEAGINGAWLLVVVAAESISVLGTFVAPALSWMKLALFLSLAAYLVGAMLYLFFITLILYRWMFFIMKPEKFTPDYWIDMGAMAITTLAGAHLVQSSGLWHLLQELTPFLTGFTLLFWVTGTWWIPLLLLVEIWRHAYRRVPLIYGPDYWSLVFPLGMYSEATARLAQTADLTFLNPIATAFVYIALAAWALTFSGMIRALLLYLRAGRSA